MPTPQIVQAKSFGRADWLQKDPPTFPLCSNGLNILHEPEAVKHGSVNVAARHGVADPEQAIAALGMGAKRLRPSAQKRGVNHRAAVNRPVLQPEIEIV